MKNLHLKNIIITGASKGIGRATALAFAQYQVNIGLVARNENDLQNLQKIIVAAGSQCEIYVGSVGDENFALNAIQSFVQKFGQIDIMINNAGIGSFKSTTEIEVDEWEKIFETNVKGTFLFCKAVIPFMKEKMNGHIINIASDVAKRTFSGGALYCASKFAQDAFSSAIRKELRPFKIKVSVVYSGLVDSSFHAEPQGDETHKSWLQNEDMASSIIFIASQPKHVVIDELMIHPIEQEY